MSSLPDRSGTGNQELRRGERRAFWAIRGGTEVSGLLICKEAAEQEIGNGLLRDRDKRRG